MSIMNFWVKVSYSFFIFVINLISVLANNENADNAKMNFVHLRILFSWGKIFTGILAKPVKRLQRKYKFSLFFSLIDDFVIQKQEFWVSLMLELKLSFCRATDISTSGEAFPEKGMLLFGFVLLFASTLFIEVVHLLPSFILQKEGQNLEQQASS